MKYISRTYLNEKFSGFKYSMQRALDKGEESSCGNLAEVLNKDDLYTLRMYTIAISKELGLPMEDSWAKEDLDELTD